MYECQLSTATFLGFSLSLVIILYIILINISFMITWCFWSRTRFVVAITFHFGLHIRARNAHFSRNALFPRKKCFWCWNLRIAHKPIAVIHIFCLRIDCIDERLIRTNTGALRITWPFAIGLNSSELRLIRIHFDLLESCADAFHRLHNFI